MRSATEYGCFVYKAGGESRLNKIERMQNKASRFRIGAMRSTSSYVVLVETGENPRRTERGQSCIG